jgi:hypothetical protein
MKIQSIYLENIKKFNQKGMIFNFADHKNIHTISGVNGSGKTAIFKSLQLFQKIFFYEQLENPTVDYLKLHQNILQDIYSLLSSSSAIIDIVFKDEEGNKFGVKLSIEIHENIFIHKFKDVASESTNALLKCWNIKDPKNIIAFIDAGKSFSDFGVPIEQINLTSRSQKNKDFILNCIFFPEKTLQGIYRKTILDHIQYRLDPSRTYEYFREANLAIKKISPNIEVKNISATKVDGHIVMLGKTSEDTPFFDVKDFSAGERALYLTLLFIFYLPSIGILIIDEPENHLHESLLREFYDFLKNRLKIANDSNIDKKEFNKEKNSLRQIFLTTHSKSLIYQNINQGECLIIKKDGTISLEDSSIERELRASGVSTVFSRTLFLEGTDDKSLLNAILENSGINLIVAKSCKEVIDYFKKISTIKNNVLGAAFCFAIDSDNRTKEDIEIIRKYDSNFFDSSFIVLEKHELENYLIDKKLIINALNPILYSMRLENLTDSKITNIFSTCSQSLKDQSKAKYIASGLQIKIKHEISDPITNTRTIQTKSIEKIIKENITDSLTQNLINEGAKLNQYFEDQWKTNWENLIDGKAFLSKIIAELSKECANINQDVIKNNIISELQKNSDKYKAGQLINQIKTKFDLQHAT